MFRRGRSQREEYESLFLVLRSLSAQEQSAMAVRRCAGSRRWGERVFVYFTHQWPTVY